jgi:hypothetical protein
MPTPLRLAVLIDAENLGQVSHVPKIMDAIAHELGLAALKRAYGDFTNTRLKNWKKALATHAIQPFQQFPVVTAKNATDIALVIDCLDLLYSKRFDGFCLVTSDSDFSRLAIRIREDGIPVYGFGKGDAKPELIAAFDRFFDVETLGKKPTEKPKTAAPARTRPGSAQKSGALADADFEAMKRVIEQCAGKDGFAPLGAVGKAVKQAIPNLNYRSLKVLLKKDPRFAFGGERHADSVRMA